MISRLALDLRSLAVFRIGLGAVLLFDLGRRSVEISTFLTDQGFTPRLLILDHYWSDFWWCLHLFTGTLPGAIFLLVVHGLLALALMVGFQTRWTALACYLATLSLHNRNPLVLDSGDRLLVLLLFWGLFIPWESRWSLDARKRDSGHYPASNSFSCPGTTGYLLQVCVMYLMAGYWKLHPIWLTEMSGVYRALMLEEFSTGLGVWLLQFPVLMKVLTLGTVVIELLGPFLLLVGNGRMRLLGVFLLASLHLGIALTMDLESFPLVSLVALLGLLPSTVWRLLLGDKEAEQGDPASSPGTNWCRGRIASSLAVLAITAIISWNAMMLLLGNRTNATLPPSLGWYSQTLGAFRLVQMWNLFSPVPRQESNRFFVEALLADGRRVDLWRNGKTLTFRPEALPSAEYPTHHHRTFLHHLTYSGHPDLQRRFLRVLAYRWNSQHENTERVLMVRLVFLFTPVKLHYRDSVPTIGQAAIHWPDPSGWAGPPVPLPRPESGLVP